MLFSALSCHPATSLHAKGSLFEYHKVFGYHLSSYMRSVFDELQEPELITALFSLNYPAAYSRLRKLTAPLSSKDAVTACLCALAGTEKLMNTVLDHCPPIPSFQFETLDSLSPLLATAARLDADKTLGVLLRRGADPNRGPDPSAPSPLETAFRHSSYLSMQQLINVKSLDTSWTESLLCTLGNLREKSLRIPAADLDFPSADLDFPQSDPYTLWSAQLLIERQTGERLNPFEPLPLPAELQIRHALISENTELALRLVRERGFTEDDKEYLVKEYGNRARFVPQKKLIEPDLEYIELLFLLLEQFPDLANTPSLRTSLISIALSVPQPDPTLLRWITSLSKGPVPIGYLLPRGRKPEYVIDLDPSCVDQFLQRWEERVPNGMFPVMDPDDLFSVRDIPHDLCRQFLQKISFIGDIHELTEDDYPADCDLILESIYSKDINISVAISILRYAPEDILPQFFQSGGLFTRCDAEYLQARCWELPAHRKQVILPLIRKEINYDF